MFELGYKKSAVIVIASFVILLMVADWCSSNIAVRPPNKEGFVPVLAFDSTEPVFPSRINFDGTWNTEGVRQRYELYAKLNENYPKYTLYTRTTVTENYTIYQYFIFYAYNPFVNYHACDPEGGAVVWVRDNRPFIFAIAEHGKWHAYAVNSVNDLYAYVQRGSHALYRSNYEAFPCDAKLIFGPSDFDLVPVEEAIEHQGEFLDADGNFRVNEPGDLASPWWTNDDTKFYDPNLILPPELKGLLNVRSSVPLETVNPYPSMTTFLINGTLLVVLAFLAGVSFGVRGWSAVSVIAVLVVVGIMVGCKLTYAPDEVLALAVTTLRVIPYAFLAIAATSAGTAINVFTDLLRKIRWSGK